MGIRRSITDEIAGIPPDGSLFIEIARSRHPSSPCNGCDFRSMVSVCDYCECTQPIDVGVTTVAEIAAANGYVKLGDDEIVVKRDTLNALIDDHCADCTFDSLEIHDCDNCDLKPIRDRLKSEEGK